MKGKKRYVSGTKIMVIKVCNVIYWKDSRF